METTNIVDFARRDGMSDVFHIQSDTTCLSKSSNLVFGPSMAEANRSSSARVLISHFASLSGNRFLCRLLVLMYNSVASAHVEDIVEVISPDTTAS